MLGQSKHLELADDAVQRQAEPIAYAHAVRGLDPLCVQVNLATRDGRRGEAAGFVKTTVPQPLIQAVLALLA
jgi:hypothetical protein